jgi:uncharacterized repeat protein (TIGR03847 family)
MATFELPDAERLVVGAVGPPGQRTFYLQARQGRRTLTLKVEKFQVAELAARLMAVFASVPDVDASPTDDEGLEPPIEPDFVVGSLSVALDEDARRVLLVAEELVEEGAQGDVARIGATFDQVAAMARRGAELVAAGRPTCQLCGLPIDPEGHQCPRLNGHTAPRP